MPGPGLGGGVGGHWRHRRRNRARPRHHRCQGGCRALGGVSRGVCGPGWGLCSALSLHASLGLVVNMRDEHNNMCNFVSVARQWCTGSDVILFIRARYSLPGGGGLGPDFGGSRPVLGSHLGCRNSHAVTPIRNRRAPPPARFCSILFPVCSHVIRIDSNRLERANDKPPTASN